jgi:short-subunit dehydrogenase
MAKETRILTGQVAAITGGARGIGRAMAEAFVRQGMRVAIGDVDVETAQQTAREIGAGTIALPLDVTSRASVESFADGVEEQLGAIDVFVNNAGIMQVGRFLEEDDATAKRQMDINVHGVIFGMKVVLPRMIQRNRGHMVNVASQAGKAGVPGLATYCASKHAVVGATEAVRGELRNMGATDVSLSLVMPNLVGTELATGVDATRASKLLTPEDVAEAVVEALRTGRFDVYVPSSAKALMTGAAIMPRPAREAVARALKADRVFWNADFDRRRGYELRAAHSQPALAPGDDDPQQLPEHVGSS